MVLNFFFCTVKFCCLFKVRILSIALLQNYTLLLKILLQPLWEYSTLWLYSKELWELQGIMGTLQSRYVLWKKEKVPLCEMDGTLVKLAHLSVLCISSYLSTLKPQQKSSQSLLLADNFRSDPRWRPTQEKNGAQIIQYLCSLACVYCKKTPVSPLLWRTWSQLNR